MTIEGIMFLALAYGLPLLSIAVGAAAAVTSHIRNRRHWQ